MKIEWAVGTETNAMTCCWFPSPGLASGGATGVAPFLERAQQLLFAQQCGLQPWVSGAFERMHDAAGSWSGVANNANTTAKKMGAVLRIIDIYHTGPTASNALATPADFDWMLTSALMGKDDMMSERQFFEPAR